MLSSTYHLCQLSIPVLSFLLHLLHSPLCQSLHQPLHLPLHNLLVIFMSSAKQYTLASLLALIYLELAIAFSCVYLEALSTYLSPSWQLCHCCYPNTFIIVLKIIYEASWIQEISLMPQVIFFSQVCLIFTK